METVAFDALVAEAVAALPERVTQKLTNIAILIEDEPDEMLRKEEGLSEGETLLGLYRGIPNTERGSWYGIGETLPDTITIFRLPTLERAREEQAESESLETAVARVVADTLWHEIGHYFGLLDPEIEHREAAGTNTYRTNEDAA